MARPLNSPASWPQTAAAAPLRAAAAAMWLPGAAFLTFYLLTVALFFWGPWTYPIGDGRAAFILFLVAVHVAFGIGYWWGTRGKPRGTRITVRVGFLVLLAATAELLLLSPTSAINTGSWIPWPGAAFDNLAEAYSSSLALREQSRPYANYVRMVLAPLLALTVPLGVYYWPQLTVLVRTLVVASVVGTIALFVAMGANAGAAQWMALFPWFVLAAHLSGVHRITSRGWLWVVAIQIASVVFFVILFTASMNQRTGSFAKHGHLPGIGADIVSPAPAPGAPGTAAGVASPPAPGAPASRARSALRVGFDGLAGYLSQGYYAVYLSLQEPFVPGYGVGNSVFLQRQAARLLGDESLLTRSYPERIQARGWNAYGYWASIYPWIASDVTFPGTVLVMGLLGWLLARVWMDVLGGQNPFAVAFFGQLLILLYYVPAHNKVMHSGEGLLAFWTLLLVWALSSSAGASRPTTA